jgi:hypothetical protein
MLEMILSPATTVSLAKLLYKYAQLFMDPQVSFFRHKNPPQDLILSHINLVHIFRI